MNIATDKKILTDEEFKELSEDGSHYELINGELVDMGTSGMEHGNITAYLCGLIELYSRPKKLGVTCDYSTAFNLKSGNKRSPDISFVSKDRLLGESLVVAPSQWKYVVAQNEETGDYIYGIKEPITFDYINIHLRRDRNKQPTKIDAVALTQEKISR